MDKHFTIKKIITTLIIEGKNFFVVKLHVPSLAGHDGVREDGYCYGTIDEALTTKKGAYIHWSDKLRLIDTLNKETIAEAIDSRTRWTRFDAYCKRNNIVKDILSEKFDKSAYHKAISMFLFDE